MPKFFTDQQLLEFEKKGYIYVPNAFSKEIAKECREIIWDRLSNQGIDRSDCNTFPVKAPLGDVYFEKDGDPWSSIFSVKLKNAIDDICGNDRWMDFGAGWWMVTFPSENTEWQAEGAWHIDGYNILRYPFSRNVGLLAIMYFSEVPPGHGGTAVLTGSHIRCSQVLIESGVKGLISKEITRCVLDEGGDFEVCELWGQAGDVVLLHPFLIHARATNMAPKSELGVRFMCHPAIALKEHINFDKNIRDMTPLERSIYVPCIEADPSNKYLLTHITPDTCLEFWKRKKKKSHGDKNRYLLFLKSFGLYSIDHRSDMALNDVVDIHENDQNEDREDDQVVGMEKKNPASIQSQGNLFSVCC